MSDPTAPVLRVEPPAWLRDPDVLRLLEAVAPARIVGGSVRDMLLGRPVDDLDVATPFEPVEVVARLKTARIRTVPTGLKHGTVTAILGHVRIEITTLRRDVETDGRHAVVEFTTSWAADAARRDFTMNALYLDREGAVWDPADGLGDCLAGRIRFIGAADDRLDEDVLRLLRFYRFQAHYGREPADEIARQACRRHIPHLDKLSGERIRVELLKLLQAPAAAAVLHLMAEDGVLDRLLGGGANLARLVGLLVCVPAADPLLRLGALLDGRQAIRLAERLKFSSRDRDRLLAMTAADPAMPLDADDRAQRRLLHRLGRETYLDRTRLAGATASSARLAALTALAEAWTAPDLPVRGADALARGVPPGAAVGRLLKDVEKWWIDGDFAATRELALEKLAELAGPARD